MQQIKIARFEQARIGGNQISGGEADAIAGRDLAARNFPPVSVAQHGGGGRHLLAQAVRRALRTVRLHEVDRDSEHHHGDNDYGVRSLAQEGGGRGGDQQNDDERVQKQQQKLDQTGPLTRRRGFVVAKLCQARGGLRRRQAGRG